jgi:DNA-binding Lrp family transcriptional regulator
LPLKIGNLSNSLPENGYSVAFPPNDFSFGGGKAPRLHRRLQKMSYLTRYCKESDLIIISHLRQDARISLTRMSRQTRIPVSTIFDKLKFFKETGLIRKNTSIVSFDRFGFNAKAFLFLSTSREKRNELAQTLMKSGNVNSLFKVNNGWDFIVEVIFPGFKEVEDFLETIEGQVSLNNKQVFYIIEELKREEFFSNPRQFTQGCH